MKSWRDAEEWLAKYIGGKLVKDKTLQLMDIDVIANDVTWSVKLQRAASRYGNFSFEVALEDAEGNFKEGNFLSCQADAYCIVVPHVDGFSAFMFDREELHSVVLSGDYPVKALSLAVEATNAGRKWSKAQNVIVPIEDLRPMALVVTVMDLEGFEMAANKERN